MGISQLIGLFTQRGCGIMSLKPHTKNFWHGWQTVSAGVLFAAREAVKHRTPGR
jgi:hypothetical protein